MKTILAQTAANNQILFRYVRTHTSNKPRVLTDKTAQKETAYIGRLKQEIENIDRAIKYASMQNLYDDDLKTPAQIAEHFAFSHDNWLGNNPQYIGTDLDQSHPPQTIEYVRCENGMLQTVKESRSEVLARRRSLLDIILKSQQPKKKHSSYGAEQSVKRFTSAAKQRILEAGAVVDRHTKRESQREVTLTIPGSGWDVYDVVSRYSGYIVNRMTQIVRRLEAEGYKLYWFFVWEHQKRGALHQHWCIASDEPPEFVHNVGRLLACKWYQLLEELSVKTGIDLFKKKGSFGTWRYSPKKWQCRVKPIKKGVARYFSKYCSKNSDTSQYNHRRRKNSARLKSGASDVSGKRPVYSFCPSRYWGSNRRIKRLCADYRVTISMDVASKRASDFISKTIYNWCNSISPEFQAVSRTFKAVCPETGFVYAEGYEWRCWVSPDALDTLIALFKAIRLHNVRRTDAVAAICDFDEIVSPLLHGCNNVRV